MDVREVLREMGEIEDSIVYYKKALTCAEELYKSRPDENGLHILYTIYDGIGLDLQKLGHYEKSVYYNKGALRIAKELYEIQPSEERLYDICSHYRNLGRILECIGEEEDAPFYYEKGIECANEYKQKWPNGSNSIWVNKICEEMEEWLNDLRKKSLEELSTKYRVIRWKFMNEERLEEALICCEKELQCLKKMYSEENAGVIQDIAVCYGEMASILFNQEQKEEAWSYGEKELYYREKQCGLEKSEINIEVMLNRCLMAKSRWLHLGHAEEIIAYYKKVEVYSKELYELNSDDESKALYIRTLKFIFECLQELGRIEEAEEYAALARELEERV